MSTFDHVYSQERLLACVAVHTISALSDVRLSRGEHN